jgi:hypothetical protein
MEPRKYLSRSNRILAAILLALALSGGAKITRAAGTAQMMMPPRSLELMVYREYSTSDPQVSYRVNGYRVYRSTKSGSIGRLVFHVAKGEELSMASVPSADVCWVIGNKGLVVVIVNGKPAQRVPIPTMLDLHSIGSKNALTATVATTDGQVYETVDGGKTWKPGSKADTPPYPFTQPGCPTCDHFKRISSKEA